MNNQEWGCAHCGERNLNEDTMPCPKCGSPRIVWIKFIEELLGIKWEDGDFYNE